MKSIPNVPIAGSLTLTGEQKSEFDGMARPSRPMFGPKKSTPAKPATKDGVQ